MIFTDPDLFDERSVLIFNHIPKCAGTTVASILESTFESFYRANSLEDVARIMRRVRDETIFDNGPVAITGHHAADSHTLFPENVKCFYCTTLRNPLRLVQSQYRYCCKTLSFNGSFEDYILNINDNYLLQYAHIGSGDPVPLNNYALVGFVEEMDQFLGRLFAMLDRKLENYESLNVSTSKHGDVEGPARDFLKILLKNDLDFYNKARESFANVPLPRSMPSSATRNKLTSTSDYQRKERELAAKGGTTIAPPVKTTEAVFMQGEHCAREIPLSINLDHMILDLVQREPLELLERLLGQIFLPPSPGVKSDTLSFHYLTMAGCYDKLKAPELASACLDEARKYFSSETGLRMYLVRLRSMAPEKLAPLLDNLPKVSGSVTTAEEFATFDKGLCNSQKQQQKLESLTARLGEVAKLKAEFLLRIRNEDILPLPCLDTKRPGAVARAAPIISVHSLIESGLNKMNTRLMVQKDVADKFDSPAKTILPSGRFYFTPEQKEELASLKNNGLQRMIICSRDLNFYSYNEYLKLASWLGMDDVFIYPFFNTFLNREERILLKA